MVPRKIVGKLEFKENLAGNNWLVRLVFEEVIEFLPGQHASLKVSDNGLRRSYSVASLPGKKTIDLLVDVSPMGVGSRYILGLGVGEPVEILGFLGNFVIDTSQLMDTEKVLFVATGTGIAPLRPMIEDLLSEKQFKGEVRLIWGMRFEKNLYWLKEIDNINRDFDNFKFDLVISKPTGDWLGYRGHVDGIVDQLKQDWSKTLVYLCGAPEMIVTMTANLEAKKISQERVYYEKFL